VSTALVEHPASPIRNAVGDSLIRRLVIGVAMGLTAAAIIYSPWGQRSGAHLNPSVTLTFLRLGKISPSDAWRYVLAQFVGAAAGVGTVLVAAHRVAGDPAVNYVATVPGRQGTAAAFVAELVISFGMMTLVLAATNSARLCRYAGVLAGCLIAIYITVEAPLSGMSMNPARSATPALFAGSVASLWIYFVAPPVGMLLAAELFVRRRGHGAVRCAKLHHGSSHACHFNCGHTEGSS
jgi:aquaporin Z